MRKMCFVWIVLGVLSFNYIEAASPMTKVYLAEKWFHVVDKYTNKEKQDFILGVLIHDIGFLEGDADVYYNPDVTLKDIYEAENPFEAGFKFHSYVKHKKEILMEKWGVSRMITGFTDGNLYLFLKLLEDEVIYDPKFFASTSGYISLISIGEILTGIEVEKLAIWHGLLYKYLSARPSQSIRFLQKENRLHQDITIDSIDLWVAAIQFFSSNDKIKNYVKDLLSEFEDSFEYFKLKYDAARKNA